MVYSKNSIKGLQRHISMVEYCDNPSCEFEATHVISEASLKLCRTCAQAFVLGQIFHGRDVSLIEDQEKQDEDNQRSQ